VPFLSLLIAIIGVFLPQDISPGTIDLGEGGFVSFLFGEIGGAPSLSLISLSAVTSLWSASRGVGAVRSGIETVYHARRGKNYLERRIKSLLSTIIFIALLTSIASLLLFGDLVLRLLDDNVSQIVYTLKTPLFITIVTVLFTCVYSSIAKRSDSVRHGFLCHVPGALFSSIGWVVFSYLYSLYIANFPGASYIYGSLAAICLIMLWIYICMIILLLGAEVNKLFLATEKHAKQGDA
jgi:membrane protein